MHELIIAIEHGNAEIVSKLLKDNPAMVNRRYTGGWPLTYVSYCKDNKGTIVLEILIRHGAKLYETDKFEEYFYIGLLRENKIQTFRAALRYLRLDSEWPRREQQVFMDTIDHGKSTATIAFLKSFESHEQMREFLLRDGLVFSIIDRLCEEEKFELIIFLIKKEIIDPNYRVGDTPLVEIFAQTEYFEQFLNICRPNIEYRNNKGETLLHFILESEVYDNLAHLSNDYLEKYINDLSKDKQTPLHVCMKNFRDTFLRFHDGDVMNSYTECIEECIEECKIDLRVIVNLLSKGARSNNADNKGKIPLEYICECSDANDIRDKELKFLKLVDDFLKKVLTLDRSFEEIFALIDDLKNQDLVNHQDLVFKFECLQSYLISLRRNYIIAQSKHLVSVEQVEAVDEDRLKEIHVVLTQAKFIPATIFAIYKKLCFMIGKTEVVFNGEYSGKNNPVSLYSYIDHPNMRAWIALPGKNITEATKLILTVLMYRSHRHEWGNIRCLVCRLLLVKINPDNPEFALDKTSNDLYSTLVRFEKEEDYFSLDYSDDSDDEHVKTHSRQARGIAATTEKYASEMSVRSNTHVFFTQKRKLKKVTYLEQKTPADFSEIVNGYGLKVTERARIFHDPQPSTEVINDLQELNQLIVSGTLKPTANLAELQEVLSGVGTKFFIAQYRGVHYSTKDWDAESRRAHRQHSEISKPVFSRSAFAMSGLNATKNFFFDDNQKSQLNLNALLLRHQITSLMEYGPIEIKESQFESPAHAVQELYTTNYSEYQKKLQLISQKCKSGELIDEPFDVAFLFSTHGEMPTISTGDTPYHALRYAYGIKVYNNAYEDRLRPRWHVGGKAERPYSGKVYTFLFDLAEYFSLRPNHVVSMKQAGKFWVKNEILQERETTFFGGLPESTLVHEHNARYPSFHRPYSKHFMVKYGFEEYMYNEYKDAITTEKAKPHSPQNQFYKFVLAEHLCAYNEVILIEDARLAAKSKGGWLIYRDNHGLFSLVPPRILPESLAKDHIKKQAAKSQQSRINSKQEARKKQTLDKGWLAKLCVNYSIQACSNLEHLVALLKLERPANIDTYNIVSNKYALNMKVAPPNEVANDFNRRCSFLQNIANHNNVSFRIVSALFSENICINPGCIDMENASEPIELVYLGGNGFFRLINKQPKLNLEQPHKTRDFEMIAQETNASRSNKNNNSSKKGIESVYEDADSGDEFDDDQNQHRVNPI